MSLFGDNPFGATVLANASDVEACEDDCALLSDYSRHTLKQLQRVFTQRERKSPRERLALFIAIESRFNRPTRPAKTWGAHLKVMFPTKAAFDATVWAVRSERAALTKMLKTLYREVFPHRVWVPGCRTRL